MLFFFFAAHGLHGLQAFFAAQGLQGLQPFFAAHGLQGLHFFAAHGLQGLHFFAAHGLHGLHFLAAHGLHFLAAQGLQAARCRCLGFGFAVGSRPDVPVAAPAAKPGALGVTAPPTAMPTPTKAVATVVDKSFVLNDLTAEPPFPFGYFLIANANQKLCI